MPWPEAGEAQCAASPTSATGPKGYARTTARDIATAAGTSLAAIGYHYGSTEALLNAAVIEAMREWGDEMSRALAGVDPGNAGSLAHFEAVWRRILESFRANRALWAVQLEMIVQSRHQPDVRRQLADSMAEARAGLAALFHGDATDPRTAASVGTLHQVLLAGVLSQWLIDPEQAPTGADLAVALRQVAATLTE